MEQDLLDNWPYVKKRHQTYTLRVPVPKELQDAVGKKEISRSLGTSDPEKGKLAYGALEHFEYLAETTDLPEQLARQLKQDLPARGHILSWNMGFENGRNVQMAEWFPEDG